MNPWKNGAVAALATLLLSATAGHAQQPQTPPPPPTDPDGFGPIGASCAADGYRAFDFWLGEWTVENANGNVVGSNTISRISNGCAVLEHWVNGAGIPGQSLNHFDATTGSWHQRWVGGNGAILEISGGLEGESMVLAGERQSANGPVHDRVTWTPMEDGSVRQHWQVSQDGGETWTDAFLGIYKRTGESTGQ